MHESSILNGEPLFVKAFDKSGECVGIVVGTLSSSRMWPFSRYCRTAVLGALPATRDKSPETEHAIMAALENDLRQYGVFRIHVCSYDSPNSAIVLSRLSYHLMDRHEFYLDLMRPLDYIWKNLRGTRR